MGDALTNSCLYDCQTMHQRIRPKKHGFQYGLFFLYLDLEEVSQLSERSSFFSHNSFNLFSFFDEDHLDLGEGNLRANLRVWLKEQNSPLLDSDHVHLLTMPRILGYIFNPVCFYFIKSQSGETKYVIVEVCNTYRELKPWLIQNVEKDHTFTRRVPKHFYVSPFSDLTDDFDFRVPTPGEQFKIDIDTYSGEEKVLTSWLQGQRKPFSTSSLLRLFAKYPLLTLQVMMKIHWQALKLWLGKFEVRPKAADPKNQRNLYRPYQPQNDV